MKKLLILSLLGFSCALGAMDNQPPKPSSSAEEKIVKEEKNEINCPICLDTLGTEGGVKALACGDVFCVACIDRWMTRSATCPVCRKTKAQLEALSQGTLPAPTLVRRQRRRNNPQTEVNLQELIPSLVAIEEFFNQLAAAEPTSQVVQQTRELVRTMRQIQQAGSAIGQLFNTLFN